QLARWSFQLGDQLADHRQRRAITQQAHHGGSERGSGPDGRERGCVESRQAHRYDLIAHRAIDHRKTSGRQRADALTMSSSIFERDLGEAPANFVPLSPLSFLQRAAHIGPDKTAVIHGTSRRNYRALYERARRLASALAAR